MRTTKPSKKRARLPAVATAFKRVVVHFPTPLLDRTERVVAELDTNRSELIRVAVEQYLEVLQRAEIEKALAEGYVANAQKHRQSCADWMQAESDLP
ncbi:MAG TPA: ribbon-helix-helix protein, CopG family [Candidatus Acidoferrales bacterium]|nr:ribbon-helix-helix protein, CopG family [Candidatus Acidoferrales bacterium]HXK03872.1 ribbon-helix-helix protein, CopG family [Verrucomicrobiae bacterium]